jgi:hypothetical protein
MRSGNYAFRLRRSAYLARVFHKQIAYHEPAVFVRFGRKYRGLVFYHAWHGRAVGAL